MAAGRDLGDTVTPMPKLMTRPGRTLLAAATAASALTVTGLAGGAAQATVARALPCSASMSNSHPADYTTTKVRVHTAAFGKVTTVAHYRTTNTKHKGTAGRKGNLSISYYISGATPGYKVTVSVTVVKGSQHGSCSTWFRPHA
jgi:hypothetical protein